MPPPGPPHSHLSPRVSRQAPSTLGEAAHVSAAGTPGSPTGRDRALPPRSSHPPPPQLRAAGTLAPFLPAAPLWSQPFSPWEGRKIPKQITVGPTQIPLFPKLPWPWLFHPFPGCSAPGEDATSPRGTALPGHPWAPAVPRSPSCPQLLPAPGRENGAAGWGCTGGGCQMPRCGIAHLLPFGAGWASSSLGALGSGQTLGERQRRIKDAEEHPWGGHPPAQPLAHGGHQHPPGIPAQGGGRHLKSSAPRAADRTLHPPWPRQPLQRESRGGSGGASPGVPGLAGASLASPGHLHSPSVPRGRGCRGSPSCPVRRRDSSGSGGEMSPVPGADGRPCLRVLQPYLCSLLPFLARGLRRKAPSAAMSPAQGHMAQGHPAQTLVPPCSWHLPGERGDPVVPLAPGDHPGRGLPGNHGC